MRTSTLAGSAAVRLQHIGSNRFGRQAVVDAKHHVGNRRFTGEDEFVEHFTGIAGFADAQFDASLFFELGQQGLGQCKRAVREYAQFGWRGLRAGR